jgi:hypothetical protein
MRYIFLLVILIPIIIVLTSCTAHNKKEIKEHRLIVSIAKQIVSPGLGWK